MAVLFVPSGEVYKTPWISQDKGGIVGKNLLYKTSLFFTKFKNYV